MALEKIIVLDDELMIRKTLEETLRRRRYSVASATTIADAERYLTRDNFDLMFVDVRLPDGDGTNLLKRVCTLPNPPLVVMITGYGSIEAAVSCIKDGAFDYILKPFSISQVEVILDKAERHAQLEQENALYRMVEGEEEFPSILIGESEGMRQIKSLIAKVAATEATVLISGPTGTGKELVAEEIHRRSARREAPFIKVNCAAMSQTLIESEFFGHEKGAFTGATQRREGRFELANGGTILLDEISEISLPLQAKLLRVLQEREFERVGGNRTIKVDIRVIATTNRDLKKAVEAGEFREDLYYRLNVFPLQMPPLAQRGEDIRLLAKEFLKRFGIKNGRAISGFEPEAIDLLVNYDWPGNVRELQNVIERAVILCEEGKQVAAKELGLDSEEIPMNGHKTDPERVHELLEDCDQEFCTLEELKRNHILRILESVDGDQVRASEILGVNLRALKTKLRSYERV